MAIISCDNCQSDNDIHLEGMAPDGSRILRCGDCGHTWSRRRRPRADLHAHAVRDGPGPLRERRDGRPGAAPASAAEDQVPQGRPPSPTPPSPTTTRGAASCSRSRACGAAAPQDLKDFVTTPLGANLGNTSMFTRAWKRLGEDVAADRTRASISYLLRGPETVPLEDRLTHLIEDHAATGMPGFKEAAAHQGAVRHGARPLPADPHLRHRGDRQARPDPGRLRAAPAQGRPHLDADRPARRVVQRPAARARRRRVPGPQHVAEFVWWAKDRVGKPALASVR